MTMNTFPSIEQVRDKLRERARQEIYLDLDGGEGWAESLPATLSTKELCEKAGPEFIALHNMLSLVGYLEGFVMTSVDPADVLETVEEQRGARRNARNVSNWLRDRIDAGLRGKAVGHVEDADV
jgi:hypothetical protein